MQMQESFMEFVRSTGVGERGDITLRVPDVPQYVKGALLTSLSINYFPMNLVYRGFYISSLTFVEKL